MVIDGVKSVLFGHRRNDITDRGPMEVISPNAVIRYHALLAHQWRVTCDSSVQAECKPIFFHQKFF